MIHLLRALRIDLLPCAAVDRFPAKGHPLAAAADSGVAYHRVGSGFLALLCVRLMAALLLLTSNYFRCYYFGGDT